MAFVANSIVSIEGKEYRPGDTIQAPADSKAMQILLSMGYVIETVDPGEIEPGEILTVKPDGHFDRSELEAMSKANLFRLAADLRISAQSSFSKSDLVEAIVAATV